MFDHRSMFLQFLFRPTNLLMAAGFALLLSTTVAAVAQSNNEAPPLPAKAAADEREQAFWTQLRARKEALEEREREFADKEKALQQRLEELSERESRLVARQAELDVKALEASCGTVVDPKQGGNATPGAPGSAAATGGPGSARPGEDRPFDFDPAYVATLVKSVKSMKPALAARMMVQLDGPLAVEILRQLAPRNTAKIFDAMPAENSARLGSLMVERDAKQDEQAANPVAAQPR